MGVGHEIIKEQQFFRKELRERVFWFIRLRWLAVAAAGAGLGAAYLDGLALPFLPLVLIIAAVGAYNLVFRDYGQRLELSPPSTAGPYILFAHFQISLDLLALYLLIWLTGGPASPLTIFVIFHVILAGILLSPASCFVYAGLVLAALGVTALLPPAGAAEGEAVDPLYRHLAFGAGVIITAYLTTSVKAALQSKGRELMGVSRELELSNTKLTSLYEMIEEVGSRTTFQKLLDSATRNAARIMGVKACSIKLYDQENNCLRFASTYGLSEDYLATDCISVEMSAVNRRIIEGSLFSIGRIEEESYFQYPENIRQEKIASMLCLPLKAEGRTLGVFCVYSGESDYFKESETGFFSLMTDLTAMAMDRLKQEMDRTWFLNKAAHQLRGPLNAIMSMLHLISGGYLEPARQLQTVDRCQKRLKILGEVINDLLKLTAQRREPEGRAKPEPLDPAEVLNSLTHLFRAKAGEKELSLEVEIGEGLPLVEGSRRLWDELFSNLIYNALKYTPPGGRVRVSLGRKEEGGLIFQVADSGIGIPEEDRSRLFTEFFRAKNAKAWEEEGTGLGLVMVKEILDRLGGRIEVDSQVGQGTTMTAFIPFRSIPAGEPEREGTA